MESNSCLWTKADCDAKAGDSGLNSPNPISRLLGFSTMSSYRIDGIDPWSSTSVSLRTRVVASLYTLWTIDVYLGSVVRMPRRVIVSLFQFTKALRFSLY